ncbi:enoyl-CoA hydratase/isomerase family protein [Arthrobacter sp. ISL-28]|uniref:enoyl-CoA hydratase/isomerase family protein n=1 Tax=Arthrobacter sp. ISL-28 TaxID=2819108 RepID=UPI001BE89411|nr:enoyl-CoA hydratase/isomerase family protein [Arthrobacter sp. ISL-28]MBT2523340.1 enoyl-CoA hydratase/isomerase family protein [Arthrobacter sp. ISL-28]
MDNDDILLRRDGHLGHIILNRPKAINALTHPMVTQIAAALDDWEHDETVATVLLTGAGERGLCAGGDIVAIHRDAVNHGTGTERFWADEYRLNARIANYPKPYVAVMDGLVLGGGVGVSAHGSLRVVTERTKVGMPETSIGFVPDVGGTYLLSRAPGELGTHAALTAATLSGADAIALGLADYFVDSSAIPALIRNLAVSRAAEAVQAPSGGSFPPSALAAERSWIDGCYAFDAVEEIVGALRASGVPAAQAAAESILAKSPTALKLTLESLRRARTSGNLAETLEQEYRVSLRCLSAPDLAEGIRAQVIDKDRKPQWAPDTLEAVSAADVASYFTDLGPRELRLATVDSGTSV